VGLDVVGGVEIERPDEGVLERLLPSEVLL
jgi:hypothetical protein